MRSHSRLHACECLSSECPDIAVTLVTLWADSILGSCRARASDDSVEATSMVSDYLFVWLCAFISCWFVCGTVIQATTLQIVGAKHA